MKALAKLKEELLALIPPTLYFLVALHLLALIRTLMLEGEGISTTTTVSIAIAALLLGKAVLIADLLPIINRFPTKPLIYNVTWKTLIYLVMSALIHYTERLIEYRREADDFVAANHELLEKMVWPHFWAVQIMLFILIFVYCTAHELARVIGKKKLLRIFFGPMPGPED